MAGIKKDRAGNYAVTFHYGGQRTKSANTKDENVAQAVKGRVEETLMRIRRGWLAVPPDVDVADFIMAGGVVPQKPVAAVATPRLTVSGLFAVYAEQINLDAKESTTWETERFHRAHLSRVFGADAHLDSLARSDFQRYVDRRSKESYRGKPTKPPTIIKELAAFRAIWNWARRLGYTKAEFPTAFKELVFPRTHQRDPFRTLAQIEAIIGRGSLTKTEQSQLWESLYLTLEEVHAVLNYVKKSALHSFIYPMFVFAAMTGARRSEICRSRIEDWDFVTLTVKVREKKRKKSRTTFRGVDVNSLCAQVMREWIESHPGGAFTIAKDGEPLTVKMATDHFKRALQGSKWAVIPGFHTFRHSFASILASKGVDDSTIDAFMGHQTTEQRERYRHLFPKDKKRAIDLLCLG